MKRGNLYIKIFLSLLFISMIILVYSFVDFNYAEKKRLSPERDQNRAVRIQMLKELIEENIRLNKGFDQAKEDLQKIISRTGKLYEARIWIENSDASPILESFTPEERPGKPPKRIYRKATRGDVTIYHVLQNNIKMFYTDIPLDPEAGKGLSLHIYYESEDSKYLSQFTVELAGILFIMIALALSLIQFIRVKVNRFRRSVLRIADGDLSHRVEVGGRGVVEDLGRAFNNMTGKLEKMINSNKEITANVSHEIRTPLARIRVVEDLLRKKFERGDYSGYERHLDNIKEDIQILDDLTGRLLEFVKLDRFETITKNEQFNPSELLNDLLIRFEPVIEFKDLNIKKDLTFSSFITGDRGTLTSAFLNILDNAFKYTPNHGVITIKTGSEQGFFVAGITNSFEKLDQKDLDNIFKPFERARLSDAAGSGLGLAITKKIVEKHGGSITALNSAEGFEILIKLPLS
jgi:signal transduction histidine kinase